MIVVRPDAAALNFILQLRNQAPTVASAHVHDMLSKEGEVFALRAHGDAKMVDHPPQEARPVR
jgi:hypothetical protein